MNLSYRTLLFDLDGTLTDSQEGIFNSILYSLKRLEVPAPPSRELRSFIGPPLRDSYRRAFGFDDAQIDIAIATYREHYETKGKFENRVYEGIPPLLDHLRRGGYRLMVATSKPEKPANEILVHFGLAQYFDFICGAQEDADRMEKWEVIAEIQRQFPDVDTARGLMIGDRRHDVLGARRCGLDCAGVLYGFGDRAELEAANARFIVRTVEALERLLL